MSGTIADRIAAVRDGGMAAILAGTMERWFVPQTRDYGVAGG